MLRAGWHHLCLTSGVLGTGECCEALEHGSAIRTARPFRKAVSPEASATWPAGSPPGFEDTLNPAQMSLLDVLFQKRALD